VRAEEKKKEVPARTGKSLPSGRGRISDGARGMISDSKSHVHLQSWSRQAAAIATDSRLAESGRFTHLDARSRDRGEQAPLHVDASVTGLRKAGTSGGQNRGNSESGFQTSIRSLKDPQCS